ncbi:MAG: hypothetical protein ACI9J5_003470, partial [Paraglaciecola sp.]
YTVALPRVRVSIFRLSLAYLGRIFFVYSWLTATNSIEFKTNRLAFSLLYPFFILPLSDIVVIVAAGTDNIIELLPRNGLSFMFRLDG